MGIGSPDGEGYAEYAVDLAEVRPELVVRAEQVPFPKQVQVKIGQERLKVVWVVLGCHLPPFVQGPNPVRLVGQILCQRANCLKKAGWMNPPHGTGSLRRPVRAINN